MDQRKYSARKKHAWSALAFGAVALLLLLSYVLFYPRLRAWCTQNFQPIYLLWSRWTVWPVFSFTAALAALNGLNLLGPLQVKSPAARKAFLWGGALILLLFGALLISFVLFQSGVWTGPSTKFVVEIFFTTQSLWLTALPAFGAAGLFLSRLR